MTTRGSRSEKVERIFQQFDTNRDGDLNRDEMAALVVAVNPRVKFSDEQISAILDEVFRTYGNLSTAKRASPSTASSALTTTEPVTWTEITTPSASSLSHWRTKMVLDQHPGRRSPLLPPLSMSVWWNPTENSELLPGLLALTTALCSMTHGSLLIILKL
ncbi:hypothetical protein OROGR_016543 [Orobanche gracilis]